VPRSSSIHSDISTRFSYQSAISGNKYTIQLFFLRCSVVFKNPPFMVVTDVDVLEIFDEIGRCFSKFVFIGHHVHRCVISALYHVTDILSVSKYSSIHSEISTEH